ncbi:hypothetical protein PMAYCL1PPCAC_03094, partial [Pristionchus mayeri]
MFLNILILLLIVLANAEEDDEDTEIGETGGGLKGLLYRRMMEQVREAPKPTKKKALQPQIYKIPGPQEPLPGRSHDSDYWPVYPFHNQYSGGLDLDPSMSRHIGGDLNIAVPSWGIMDIYGRYFNRIHDTTTKFGYMNHPVNMMDLEKEDLVELITDPSAQWNREQQPRLPLGKLARNYVPLNCKPPLCNPYHMNFGLGIEHDFGGHDGIEGDIDVPIPISKGIAYRLPFSGKLYYARDNVTVTYGHNLAPIDPYASLFDYQKYRDPALAIPRHTDRRRKRSIVAEGPSRVNDADGIDSNEVDDVDSEKKTWKNFEIDPNASITMPRADFVRMMKMQQVQQAQQVQQMHQTRMHLQQQAMLRQTMYARARQEMAWRQLRMERNRRASQYQ